MKSRSFAWPLVGLALVSACVAAGERGGVSIDAKDVPLAQIAKLLAAQGGPTLAVHPDVADEKVSFAVKEVSAGAATRWLCRACGLVVVSSNGRLVLGRPAIEKSAPKEYRVSQLVKTEKAAEALVEFIENVLFALRPGRARNAQGELEPQLEVTCKSGRLKVTAPAVVQREVVALLRAMDRADRPQTPRDVEVSYRSYELGFLGTHSRAEAPRPSGTVTLKVAEAPAPEAAWELTSGSKVSFFVDPWDAKVKETKVSLEATKQPLKEAAAKMAEALGTEQCSYDEAWVFVRTARRPLFEGYSVRVYNLGDDLRSAVVGFLKGEAKEFLGEREVPNSVAQVGDRLLVAGREHLHGLLEKVLKSGVPEVGGPFGGWGRRGRR